MKLSKRHVLIPTLFVFVLGAVLGMRFNGYVSGNDPAESLNKIRETFMLINRQYVEDVDPGELAESAIAAMLRELDPHTIYIDSKDVQGVQDQYQGSFGGIGIWFEVPAHDTARVTSTFPDGPSERLGVMSGDRIIAVDDVDIVGMGSLDIQNRIKGPVDTVVSVTVLRPGIPDPMTFDITRARIPLFSVDSSFMMDDHTGYLKIGRFAVTTTREFREHVLELKSEGMEQLILDLRSNPGGVKETAVQVADEMLDGNGIIVTTRGKDPRENEIDRIRRGGVLTDEPVIILVDESSASGSEIVAGALQDHDRALIVGRRTFGKGLVQRPFQLSDKSIIQMTVARYYMPSGRLIQTPYENGELEAYYEEKFSDYDQTVFDPSAYLEDIPDSLRFSTARGRSVFGGGGVMPDVVVAPDSLSTLSSSLVQALLRMGHPFLFVRDFADNDSGIRDQWIDDRDGFLSDYTVSAETWDKFLAYLEEAGISFKANNADTSQGEFLVAELVHARSVLETVIKARIAQRLFRAEAWYPVFNEIDPVVQAAMDLWEEAEALSAYHAPSDSSSSRRDG